MARLAAVTRSRGQINLEVPGWERGTLQLQMVSRAKTVTLAAYTVSKGAIRRGGMSINVEQAKALRTFLDESIARIEGGLP